MAYTDIALRTVDRDDVTEDTAATQTVAIADGGHLNGHSFLNDGRTFISFRNGAGAAVIYVYIPILVDGSAVVMKTYNLLAATDGFLGPFPTAIYNQGVDGDVHFGSDGAANLTYWPWRLS